MKHSDLLKVLTVSAGLFSLHCGSSASAPPDLGSPGQNPLGAAGEAPTGPNGQSGYGGYMNYAGAGPVGGGAYAGAGAGVPGGNGPTGGGYGTGTGGYIGTAGSAGEGPSATGSAPPTVDPVGNANRAPGFVDLSPPMGAPLDGVGTTLNPAAPTGWTWYQIDGAVCRDGSPTGFFVHTGTTDKLVIYLEGGGACSDDHFCAFNPASANQILAGDGQTVLGSTAGAGPGRQQPGGYTDATHTGAPSGIFDFSNAANPMKDWNQIYVPYCTGDVYFGTHADAPVPNMQPQQYVGYLDMQKFIGRIVPTFKDKVSHVILTGASAGGFGAALTFSMVQDAFGDVPVDVIDDSGPPFDDKYMPPCMQKFWRDLWGYNAAFPPDCTECFQSDGAGMIHLADFLMRKHPKARIALVSSMQDEVIRLFYSMGLKDCSTIQTADPVAIVLGQADPTVYFSAQQYTEGLNALRTAYQPSGRFATYFMGGTNITYHQHIFRARFYDSSVGSETIAQFVTNFLNGQVEQIGP